MPDPEARFDTLPMVKPRDPLALAQEREWLRGLEQQSAVRRTFAFLKHGGPGYLQSALTLGAGTAASSLFAGAAFGYQLLWVAPVSMLLGVIMLAAVAHQTLSTGMRPLPAMRRHAGPFFAYAWALGALIASVVWHIPQYSLASAVLVDLGEACGRTLPRGPLGLLVLGVATPVVMLYGSSPRWIRVFETLLRVMIYGIIVCFGVVVAKTGIAHPGDLMRGFFGFAIPPANHGVSGLSVVISGLAASVGVNMLFLYPYTLLARGWGREHRRIARFDLFAGMFVPYLIATSLMVIATANTFYYGDVEFTGTNLSPLTAAKALSGVLGANAGRIIFDLGLLGMAVSTIILHMLCAGFVCAELFDLPIGDWRYRLCCLVPAPAVIGAFLWTSIPIWLAVRTNILCGVLLPLAYVGFMVLQRSRAYLGPDRPAGPRAIAWLIGMGVATLTLVIFLAFYIQRQFTS